jgi:predicted transcriptional regulator
MGKQTGLYATVFDAVSDPKEMLNVMLKKLQLYNETEAVLKESRNKLILGFMKVAIENRMMITQIKNGLDLQVKDLTKRIEQLEEKERQDGEQKGGSS